MTSLHIFALNAELDLRHTNLTRAQGAVADLPPLAEWLGIKALDETEIELFPVKDLGEMTLSDYVTAAFAPSQPVAGEVRARLDALEGSVLMVPDGAVSGTAQPGAEATLIATIPLAEADHSANLPPAEVAPVAAEPPAAPEPERSGGISFYLLITVAMAIVLLLVFAL